ncbi:hypothetical protein BHE90_011230 [Fusarium euwallaceae]|uniref:Uncharacterized protein n=2 Tax=Fusarium solani species complex TaxID=232080 RepID=A0A430LF34_9HYPO|nr:hypothetical protein CEP51_010890 [Fusarium floridanum]RTE74338.1 hypothetical protein BHE90_011230 [Fusarium euwallaceae]
MSFSTERSPPGCLEPVHTCVLLQNLDEACNEEAHIDLMAHVVSYANIVATTPTPWVWVAAFMRMRRRVCDGCRSNGDNNSATADSHSAAGQRQRQPQQHQIDQQQVNLTNQEPLASLDATIDNSQSLTHIGECD